MELTPQLSLEPSISFNWIELPQGRFDQHVAVTRLTYTLTPRAYVSGLVQYNSGSRAVSAANASPAAPLPASHATLSSRSPA